ncbi:DNA replication initiation factor cdc45 [Rhodotorula kratochvilovae]
MILPSGLYAAAYQQILARARGSPACTTYLFVAPDVDALCAARLLSALLKTDDVAHQTVPVGSWAQLAEEAEQLRDEDIRNLILIGLGATADLYALFGSGDAATGQSGLDFPPSCMIHVVDAHRPIALANLFTRSDYARAVFDPRRARAVGAGGAALARLGPLPEEELCVVVWDEVREKKIEGAAEGDAQEDPWKREREAWRELEPYPPSDSDDSDDSEEEPEEDDEDEDSQGVRRKRRRTDSPKPLSRDQRRAYRAQLAKYEAKGSSFGQSVAGMMYLLAEGLGRADIDSVWLAILGLTHQLTNSLIDLSAYESLQSLFATEVARLSSSAAALEAGNVSTAHASTSERDRSIRPSEELRFCLFRHWNLYDAMYHSGYLGGRMKLWTLEGRKKLSGLLAKMGLSLNESSETYAHMSSDLKASLFPMLSEQRAAYGLWDLTYPSFVRKSGWRVDLSASDCVESLGAMLEAATGVRLDFSSAVDGRRALVGGEAAAGPGQHSAATQHGGREEWAAGIRSWVAKGGEGDKENRNPDGTLVGEKDEEGMTEKEKRARRDRDESEARRRNFWYAWDALDPEDTTLLRKALPLSMALHRAVLAQGSYLFDKQAIRMFRSYRLAMLKEGPDLPVFQHPATLLRLAHWLVDSIRALLEHHSSAAGAGAAASAKNLPLVLAALNEKSDKFLVVGVVPADEFGDVRRNRFGRAFEEAAIRSRAKAQQRYFDASVVEVRRDDFDKFLKDLSMG